MPILNSVDQLMVIAAFRHCLGSRTYMSGACVQWLHDNWPQLTEKCQNVIARELEEAFRSDDLALDSHPHMVRVFDDISRSTWMRLRDLYSPSRYIEELTSRITLITGHVPVKLILVRQWGGNSCEAASYSKISNK